jgi:hypothetical protein
MRAQSGALRRPDGIAPIGGQQLIRQGTDARRRDAGTVDLSRVVVMAFGLWIASEAVGGVHLAAGLGGLEHIGTLLVVAMLFTIVDALATGVRRAVRIVCEPLPVAVAAMLALNGLLVWLTAALAGAAGLAFAVDGYLPALMVWLILGACRGTLLSPRAA